jgi:hypothetical protein
MDPDKIDKIRELLFTRVEDAQRRAKIFQLAEVLSEGDEGDYWSTIYHYSLSEHWKDLDDDHEQFVGPSGPFNLVSEGGQRSAGRDEPVRKVRKK